MQKRTMTAMTMSAVTLATVAMWPQAEAASVLTVNLDTAATFAILAGSGITIAAPADTIIKGDIGAFPTASITGSGNATLTGVNQAGNSVTQTAKVHLQSAYTDAESRTADFVYGDGANLTGTLIGGVYKSAGSFLINSTITLDGGGNSNTVWIFQTASTLEAAAASSFALTNGALASNVFWQVGSSATLNTTASFVGSILANQSITLNAGVNIIGRALAINGAVTLGSTTIAVPEPSAPLLLGAGAICMLAGNRRRQSFEASCVD